MPRVAAGVPAAHLHNMKSRLASHPHFNWRYLLRAAMNLALTFQKVHESGYVIGDVNDQGVLVTGNAVVALVDCDSFQVQRSGERPRVSLHGRHEPVHAARARRLQLRDDRSHADARPVRARRCSIYQFLMGCHPFQVKIAPIEDMCRR